MSSVIQLWNDAAAAHQPESFRFMYKITGAKAGSFLAPAPRETHGYDAPGSATAALGQTTVDNLLGSTSEFVSATAFGSTAMGTDAFAVVFDLGGQLKFNDQMQLKLTVQTGSTTASSYLVQAQTSALANTLAAPARMQISSAGNVAIQLVHAGLDAATSGSILFELQIHSK